MAERYWITTHTAYKEGNDLDDYTASKVARQEYEKRVQAHTPAYDHDYRLMDDRQLTVYPIRAGVVGRLDGRRKWMSARIGHLFYTTAIRLASALIWMRFRQGVSPHVPLTEEESTSVLN